MCLDIKNSKIEAIEDNYWAKNGVERCLEEVINCWFKGNGRRLSWSVLCEALRHVLVSHPAVADAIELKYVLCLD